jgi:hypothetical protein
MKYVRSPVGRSPRYIERISGWVGCEPVQQQFGHLVGLFIEDPINGHTDKVLVR